MSNWKSFPEKSWLPVESVLTGFGQGEGSYGAAYAIDAALGPFLNGRVSARILLTDHRPLKGAGVVARADGLRSFAAFYVVTDNNEPQMFSVRSAVFKQGKLDSLVGFKHPISLPDNSFQIALQFFSGEIVGSVHSSESTYEVRCLVPGLPFPGYCGIARFYSSSVVAQNIHIEEIAMKPILPEGGTGEETQEHEYDVFLSYSIVDKEIVAKVIGALRKEGISYWVDHEQITFGDGIVAKIEEGLQKSRFVVVCLSENLVHSGWCRAEYGPILYREFSGDTSRRVVPLSLDGSESRDSIPLLLSDKMRADFTNEEKFNLFTKFLRESRRK